MSRRPCKWSRTTPIWPPFHCFGRPIWRTWRHGKTTWTPRHVVTNQEQSKRPSLNVHLSLLKTNVSSTFSSFFYQALCFQEITRNDCSVASDDGLFLVAFIGGNYNRTSLRARPVCSQRIRSLQQIVQSQGEPQWSSDGQADSNMRWGKDR